jgi:uncharacterized damage-inducible protein DinB
VYTSDSLLDFQARAHRSLAKLLDHCRQFSLDEINREIDGFGYPTIRLQLHHVIGAEKYWIGVIKGRIDIDDDDLKYPTIESLEYFRREVFGHTDEYLRTSSNDELNKARPMITWGGKERILIPALVFFRTQTHIYHHLGQVSAICRLLDKPIPTGMDFPLD